MISIMDSQGGYEDFLNFFCPSIERTNFSKRAVIVSSPRSRREM